jgi:TetR/AcrR family transcriptional regulator, regulator of cefoperazone and chloramphenicol sensitivity
VTESKRKLKTHDRAATERALLEAAARLFSEKGYEGTTTREIAESADCAEALIQRYYGGKNGLLLTIVKEGLLKTPTVDIAKLPFVESLVAEIEQIFRAAAENLHNRSQHIRITFSRALIDPDFKDFKKIVMRPERLAVVEQRLTRYRDEGMVDASIDLGAASEMLLGGIFQLAFVHRQVMRIGKVEYATKSLGFCKIFARGIAPIQPADDPSLIAT